MVFIIQYNGEELFFKQAYDELSTISTIYSNYSSDIHIDFFDTGVVDNNEAEFQKCFLATSSANFVYMNIHGAIPYFKKFNALQKIFMGKIPSFIHTGIDDENVEMQKQSSLSPVLYSELLKYQHAGGKDNYKSFILLIMKELGSFDCEPDRVSIPKWDGLYGLNGVGEEEYLDFVVTQASRPVIGILIHYSTIQHSNTRHIDALIDSIKLHGAVPLAMYTNMVPMEGGYLGLCGAFEKYMLRDKKPIVDVLIVTSGFTLSLLASPGDGTSKVETSIFEMLDVPVLQAMCTFFSYEQWESSLVGIDSMLLCSNVYQPEFDGQIITVTIACTEAVQTPYGIKAVAQPIPERVDKVVRLCINWAKLRKKPIHEKKVAIILHNMPPRADMIGCAYGLDTPESVYNMYCLLRNKGLILEYDFESGQEIIAKITNGVTNDRSFLSEYEMLARSVAVAVKSSYTSWFEAMPEKVRGELQRDWGDMPGDFMTVDEKILIPGIINGNLFIGLQPPRAFEEKAEEAYHSTDLVCPYQYLAFYRYLKHEFGADVFVHVGCHGTLEWLPGKEIGLSNGCYPDLAIDDMPHLYPYIINVPGEGAQAKRRSYAVIIDHLIPSMIESGTYGALTGIDEKISEYYRAKIFDTSKLEILSKEIWDMVVEANVHTDLGLSQADFFNDVELELKRLHLWLSDIKSAKIKDGLHIFGEVPREGRYGNMLRLLVSIQNGDVPSLREGLCHLAGEDLEDLLQDPAKQRVDGRTNAMVLEEIDEVGRRIFESFGELGYTWEAASSVTDGLEGNIVDKYALIKCLQFVAKTIKPRLDATTDELKYFDRGIDARFVAPGPSGAPSRGNATILPTGRNFFMIDPTTIPSRSAWETGKRLGDQLLWRYLEDEGQYPENIAIVVYAGETIKTMGDDVAEIMYLYGVRPVWIENTDRVIDLEVIPLEELGRPRIDVTLRISGLFRDTFPNLIERIEDAVTLVASLDEPDEMNYVKKHIMADFSEFVSQGMQREQAFEYAKLRLFGCPPGTYGAGVDIQINSQKWETTEDLGRAYINWGAHAYGRKIHGTKLQDLFSHRLKSCDVTVKNISSFESDMLDDDDYYNYHGGLISAIKSQKGKLPASYSTNAGDPKHVQTRNIHEEMSRIMRIRINNPRWIDGLKEHGFRGAQEFSAMVDIVFGWDATSNVVDDWMYESITKTYLLDEELQAWIREVNPWALQAISARLFEAAQRGMWDADEDMLEKIKEIYLSVEGDLEDM